MAADGLLLFPRFLTTFAAMLPISNWATQQQTMMEEAMLSYEELEHLLVSPNIPIMGRQIINAIRTSEPSRRTGGGTHNVTTRFASRKMGVTIQAESHKNELPALYLWEHDPATFEFYDQPPPIKISYQNANKKKSTHLSTPDFFLIQKGWIGWVECKTEEWLIASHESGCQRFIPDDNGGWRCPAGEEYARQYGLCFRVRSSKENPWILVRNLEFLSDYFVDTCPMPSSGDEQKIRDALVDERWMLQRDLLQKEGVVADAVYKLIANGNLFADLCNELLTEPNYTSISRDSESAKIYVCQKQGRVQIAASDLCTIKMKPQTDIMWDGKPWRIVNVGAQEIFLMFEGKDIVHLESTMFQSLVAQGKIVGLPEMNEQESLAEKLVKQASPIDLQRATNCLAHLDVAANVELGSAVSDRTLRYWRAQARQGAAAFGSPFLGLVSRISSRGNRNRRLPYEVINLMSEVIDNKVLTSAQPTILAAYGDLVNVCREKGWICPSEKTFRKEISQRRLDARILAREGRKAAYKETEFYWSVDQSTPRHGERPFGVGHIDHTEVDLEMVDGETGANLGRAWLTVLLDAFTRMVLAFFLTFDPPSYRSCMSVIRECVRRHGRIPSTIVVDRGSDFESAYFEVLLARLACHKKSRPAAKSRFGSLIERFFGVANQTFFHNLSGNSQALQSPRSMSPSHDPRKLAVWTLSALNGLFERYAYEHYAKWRHSALGTSPEEAMARGLAITGSRKHLAIPFTADFRFLCLPTTSKGSARVHAGQGISINRIDYWHPAFRDIGAIKTLPVRYDPFDVSVAYAYLRREWLECRSQYRAVLERRTEREIMMISQEIRARHVQKDVHRRVKAGDIAAFLEGAYETEVVLRQQRRDAQNMAEEPDAPPSQDHFTIPGAIEVAEDPWGNAVNLELFGELK
ncbi:DNA-binding domain-containing protein [Undibacterium sp. Ji83W]|uniref:DNA-binding domain-containing protein n=1 Tax=Undibacterium sp. Ji83W TaxID=3413043 RepID=UPI003BF0D5FD